MLQGNITQSPVGHPSFKQKTWHLVAGEQKAERLTGILNAT
jgi:hypothetical protein